MIDLPPPPPPPPEPVPEGWEGILSPGERILWQGRPVGGVDWRELIDARTPFGLFFAGFALFWMKMAASMGNVGRGFDPIGQIFPLFGLPFLAIGLYMAFGRVLWSAFQRGRTWYTLTDRTAFVATQTLGQRRLDRFALDPGMKRVLEAEADGPGSVWFSETLIHHQGRWTGTSNNRRYRGPWTERRRAGFERIAEARKVYALLRDAQAQLGQTGERE